MKEKDRKKLCFFDIGVCNWSCRAKRSVVIKST